MPTYIYTCECGDSFERNLPVSKCKKEVRCECGNVARRDFAAEHNGVSHRPGNWPMKSDSMGVHPDQCAAAYEQSVRLGVPTQFDRKTGCAILTSQRHRKQFGEAIGCYDRNGSYGDPQRR